MKSSIAFKVITLFIVFLLSEKAGIHAQTSPRIEDLISRMTLEEKVGQMTQVTVDMICKGQAYNVQVPFEVDEAKLNRAVLEYKVGSILNVPSGSYPGPEAWQRLIRKIDATAQTTDKKIPVLYGFDAIHGANYCEGATLFPQPLAMACTWNTELARRAGEITAYESRAAGIPWNFAPALDIGRNPEWPRMWESFGEDVLINRMMGEATVLGHQGDGLSNNTSMAVCLKHYTGYGMPLSGKDRSPAWIPERYLHEYYLPQYRQAIQAGAVTAMINSGEINGIPTHADKHLLTDILKGELGLQGFIVKDWQDIHYLHDRHRIAPSLKEAVRLAVDAGIDMSMTPTSYDFADLLVELVREGKISEERINESVRRILSVKEKLGLFETPVHNFNDYPGFGSDEHQAVSLEAATESIVLLKNASSGGRNILPLSENTRVLVTGPTAHSIGALNGGWTVSWQGDRADKALSSYNTIQEAIVKIAGPNANYVAGASYDELLGVESVKQAAGSADCIVLCLGELSYCEDVGNLNDLNLPEVQYAFANEILQLNKPVILVYTGGRPRIIREVVPGCQAVLGAFYPGPMGGDAIASILFGRQNPSGRLAFTYPQYPNSLVPYDHKYTEARTVMQAGEMYNPQFEFGSGLSYTTFKYSDLQLNKSSYSTDEQIEIRVDVQNNGQRAGKEVVQVYVSDHYASITPPVKRLRAFKKIDLNPGVITTVTFSLPVSELSFVGIDNKWVVEPGSFTLMVGNLEQDFAVR